MFLASFCRCAQVLIFSPPLLQPPPSLFCAFHRPLSLILPCVDLPSPPNRCCSLRTRECKRRRPYSTMERSQGCRQCRQSPSPGRFARSRLLFFMVWPPAHLHHSICLPVLHAPPLCPMPFDPLLFFPCPSLPTNTTFRVSWWIAFLLRCHLSTRA